MLMAHLMVVVKGILQPNSAKGKKTS
jgi:hypothetical protein